MDKKQLLETLNLVKQNSPKRKFKQSVDLIINLKGLNVKKSDQHIDFFAPIQFSRGKKTKVCALVGPEMRDNAKNVCDNVIILDEFEKYQKDKKLAKKLAKEFDFFIAQANLMAKVATSFGRVLGPRGKMPNPKAGCVVPPNANLKTLYEKLQKTIRITAKVEPILQIMVGKEDMKEDELIDNAMNLYDQVVHHLPNETQNIRDVYLKLTMGPALRIGEKKLSNESEKSQKSKISGKLETSSKSPTGLEKSKTFQKEDALKKEVKEKPKQEKKPEEKKEAKKKVKKEKPESKTD